MAKQVAMEQLVSAVQRYFDLMYDCDTKNFDRVFYKTSQLHGFREGRMSMWTANEYKEVLNKRQSPKSLGALREEEILMVDFASPTQALVKARVRINTAVFLDYLTFHHVDGEWVITSKAYHLV
jgi:hypothetical protein